MTTTELIQSKIYNLAELERQVAIWKFQSKKVVFTNGCFDLVHLGHMDYLAKAADEGDILIVGVNSDTSASRIKGHHRPINNEEQRRTVLASLHFVDAVILFEEDTPIEVIKALRPDVLVKGGDYEVKDIVGNDIVTSGGGTVKTIAFLPGYSSSLIEEKIKKNR